MNVWGIVLALAGLVAVYVGVKGDPAGLAKAFAVAGSTDAATTPATTAGTTPTLTGPVTASSTPVLPGTGANVAAPANGIIPGNNGGPAIVIPGLS